ncbi:putative efflux pump antibiotic resistance protein [Colletotrichum falcatum]|nr:putative efflux pump antibiotic resistance protein [Colletotrichum falcatum]
MAVVDEGKDSSGDTGLGDATSSKAGSTSPAGYGSKEDEKRSQQGPDGSETALQAETPPRDIDGWKWHLTITSILLSTFIYALDNTVVADLQPVIILEFGDIQKLSWLSVAFLLTATATNLAWGRLYSHFNPKWLYIFHVALFEVGSVVCGAAPNMDVMILGRAIAGAGGSGLYVGCMTLISTTTTMAERPLYVSSTGLTWGLGIVLGPVVGGAFSESSVGWRWAFYINLFIGAVCAPFYVFLIPSKDPRPGASLRSRFVEVDYAGFTLQAGALTALILAVNLGGVVYPWGSGRIVALFVVTGVLFVILGFQQVLNIFTTPDRRTIPIQFFRSRSVLVLFVVCATGGAVSFFTRNDGPLDAGVRLLPFIVVMVVIVFGNGALMPKLGYYMPWYLVGGLLVVVGGALMYTVEQDTPASRVYGYTVIIGAGVGMFLQASFSVVQTVVKPSDIPPAIGFITLAQFVGITLSLAIANAILLNSSQDEIQHILPDTPPADIQAAILGARSSLVRGLSAELRTRVLDAIVKAIDQTYTLVIAAGGLTAILSLIMRRQRLFGPSTGIAAA